MTILTFGLLASAWAAIEGYDIMLSNPDTSALNFLGTVIFLFSIVLLAVDACQILHDYGVL